MGHFDGHVAALGQLGSGALPLAWGANEENCLDRALDPQCGHVALAVRLFRSSSQGSLQSSQMYS